MGCLRLQKSVVKKCDRRQACPVKAELAMRLEGSQSNDPWALPLEVRWVLQFSMEIWLLSLYLSWSYHCYCSRSCLYVFMKGLAGVPNCHRREMAQPMTAERKGLSLGTGVVWHGKWNSGFIPASWHLFHCSFSLECHKSIKHTSLSTAPQPLKLGTSPQAVTMGWCGSGTTWTLKGFDGALNPNAKFLSSAWWPSRLIVAFRNGVVRGQTSPVFVPELHRIGLEATTGAI